MEGLIYKYEIITAEGEKLLKSDPYAFYSELRSNTALIVYSLRDYEGKIRSGFNNEKKEISL